MTPTPAAELRRRRQPYPFQVSPQLTVLMRRVDMQTLIMEGLVPATLLDAAERFEKIGVAVASGEKSAKDVMEGNDKEDMSEMVLFMRHYAVVAVAEPIMVFEDDGDINHFPVRDLTVDELMAIWNAAPPEEEGVPKVTTDRAIEFRRPEKQDDVPAAPTGESVRSTAELVDKPERESIHA